jgi:uncharacterized UPF0160 family protein
MKIINSAWPVAATHNGTFHADDVMAGSILAIVHHWKINFIRSRDPEVLAAANIVYDVGGVYDPASGRFDHHQRDCDVRWNGQNRMSSAGMVWLQYGGIVVQRESEGILDGAGRMEVWEEVYQTLIKHIDDLDNGVGELTKGTLSDATLSSAIGDFNCVGNATEDQHHREYMHALEMTMGTVSRRVRHCVEAVRQRMAIRAKHEGQKVVVLEEPIDPMVVSRSLLDALLIIQPQYGQWMVVCVPPKGDRFSQRLPFPESMKGLRGPALAAVLADGPAKEEAEADTTGAQTMVHGFRFCGGMVTKEGALDLAQQVLSA